MLTRCTKALPAGSSRATAGPGEPLSRGPITTSFRMRRDRDAKASSMGRKRGEVCLLAIQLGSGAQEKRILCIFQVRKKPYGRTFSLILSDGGAPQTSRGPGKLPLSTGLFAKMEISQLFIKDSDVKGTRGHTLQLEKPVYIFLFKRPT